MPYITFSKKFPNQAKLAKTLKEKSVRSIVEQRGSKSINKVVEIAALKGFKNVVIIINDSGLKALRISSKQTGHGLSWALKKVQKLESVEEVLKFK